MSIVSFIVIAIAFGISFMLLMQRCADAAPVPLSSGLLISLTMAVVQVALFCLGILLGNMMRFELPDDPEAFARPNAFIFLGMSIFVAAKMLWPYMGRKTKPASFDLNAGTLRVLLFTVAAGINGFLLGLGAGFVASLAALALSGLFFWLLTNLNERLYENVAPEVEFLLDSLTAGISIVAVVNAG